jgi:hypothetical protein
VYVKSLIIYFGLIHTNLVKVQWLCSHCHTAIFQSLVLVTNAECFGHTWTSPGILDIVSLYAVLYSYRVKRQLKK